MREDDEEFRHYVPLLRRIIILVAVITAVPVILWTITAFVRTYVGPPKIPTFHQLAATASINAPSDATAGGVEQSTNRNGRGTGNCDRCSRRAGCAEGTAARRSRAGRRRRCTRARRADICGHVGDAGSVAGSRRFPAVTACRGRQRDTEQHGSCQRGTAGGDGTGGRRPARFGSAVRTDSASAPSAA
jgi:hypothetical protein